MTTLAPPSPAPPPPQLEPPVVSFFGRSLAEYTQCFALDLLALRGRDVLDVASGPSSFVAEACARRIDAVAVDPLYRGSAEEFAARLEAEWQSRPPRTGPRVSAAIAVDR